VLAVCGQDSSGGFLVNKLVITGRIIIYPMEGECWQSADKILPVDSSSVGSPRTKNPPDCNKSRIPYVEGSLPHKQIFLKF
jgi:hypothetical protein